MRFGAVEFSASAQSKGINLITGASLGD